MPTIRTSCDLCSATGELAALAVAPRDDLVTLCPVCRAGVEGRVTDAPHWRCLSDAIWSETPAAQVTAYRLLHRLRSEAWARELLDIAYLAPELLDWAEDPRSAHDAEQRAAGEGDGAVEHRDGNGVLLAAGDTVTLVKDLTVKGAGFTAKRGTAVRGISLVHDNADQIEGRVNGQQIVILCQFVKKSG